MKTISQRRNGFTLVEVTVASGLTVLLAVVLASTWAALNRPTSDLIAWTRLFQEMDIAVASIARDLGGSLPEYQDIASGTLGGKADGHLVKCRQYPPPPSPAPACSCGSPLDMPAGRLVAGCPGRHGHRVSRRRGVAHSGAVEYLGHTNQGVHRRQQRR